MWPDGGGRGNPPGNEMSEKQPRWSNEELRLLQTHNNRQIAELTGRPLVEVEDRRLLANIERNCWDVLDPECAE